MNSLQNVVPGIRCLQCIPHDLSIAIPHVPFPEGLNTLKPFPYFSFSGLDVKRLSVLGIGCEEVASSRDCL